MNERKSEPHQLELNSKRINEINLNLNEADWWGSNSISFSMKLLGAPQQQTQQSSTFIHQPIQSKLKKFSFVGG